MNWKTWIPLVLAVVLGLVAALVARESMSRNRAVAPPPPPVVKIVVAKGEVAPGQQLTAEMMTLGPIASAVPPPGSFTDVGAVVGRVAHAPLFDGQPVIDNLLAPRGAGTGIQALVPRGMRAITVDVTETTGLAGLLLPGCRVDLVSTLNGESKEDTVAATIVQDVLVQAVGQRLTAPAAGTPSEKDSQAHVARSVTLVVTPREAEAIELASSVGRTRLVLRGSNDRGVSDSEGVTFMALRGDGKEVVRLPVAGVTPPPMAPDTHPVEPGGAVAKTDPFAEEVRTRRTVTLIKGGSKLEVVFELPAKPESGPKLDPKSDTNPGAKSDTAVTKTPVED